MCVSLDGYVTTPDGWPVQVADPDWSPEAFGFVDFQRSLDAVLMGRTTFDPAVGRGPLAVARPRRLRPRLAPA